jgi:ParB-like chromosome segregation protein Spo0J
MARKRLTPPQEIFLAPAPAEAAPGLPGPFSSAPIARIAAETTAVSAVRDLSDALTSARVEGRLVVSLPLAAIEVDHLIRDRVTSDPEEMSALRDSLRARGQQQPIDVVDLGAGRYGLISGWRRLTALQELLEETGEARFGHVQALLRRPDGASDAYLAMVEENEIRAGLSHYERARIVARAAEQGVFASPQEALRHLFANASRAKRSKIGSFVTLHQALGQVLTFPSAIPERLGLALAQALEADTTLAPRIIATLATARPTTAIEEMALLSATLKPAKTGSAHAERPKAIHLQTFRDGRGLSVTLTGTGIDEPLIKRLTAWLSRQD